MQVICLEEPAFFALVDQVVNYIKTTHQILEDKWVDPEEAMRLLNISSKTTLQKFRDEGRIRFSQSPDGYKIVYDRDSIMEWHQRNAKGTF
jgi:helix-turn-helix protein